MNEHNSLTLEELRKMDGKPVYYKTAKQWFIVALNYPDFGDCVINASGQYVSLEKAARQNRFYAIEPPRLDRSAWKPCNNCKSKCRTCLRNETRRCIKCKNFDCYFPVNNFCPYCGRPLTDMAWEMVEREIALCL